MEVCPVGKCVDNDPSMRRLGKFVGCFLLATFLAFQLVRELNPLAGTWTPVRATLDGTPLGDVQGWRLFLNIETDGYAKAAEYWTCGVARTSYTEGKIKVSPTTLSVHEYQWATGFVNPNPCGELKRLANGNLTMNVATADAKIIVVELARESNAESVFDWAGWQ